MIYNNENLYYQTKKLRCTHTTVTNLLEVNRSNKNRANIIENIKLNIYYLKLKKILKMQ